jgi:hypothetical protein
LYHSFQDEETENLLAADFEIGHFIRERLVPRAVLYFTGEALDDDDEVRGRNTEMRGSSIGRNCHIGDYRFGYKPWALGITNYKPRATDPGGSKQSLEGFSRQ